MKDKLKLIKTGKRTYIVPVPKRLQEEDNTPTKIQIHFEDNEFQYLPRKKTFGMGIRFSSDELRAIADELDKLNKEFL